MPQATIDALPSARVLSAVVLIALALTEHTAHLVQAAAGAQGPGPARAPSGVPQAVLPPTPAPLEGLVSIKSLPYPGQIPVASIALPDQQDSSSAMPTQAPVKAGAMQSAGLSEDSGGLSGTAAAGGGQSVSGNALGDTAASGGGVSGGDGSVGAGPAGSPLGAASASSLGGSGGGGNALVFDGSGNVVSGGSGFGDVSSSYTGKQQWPELVGTNALAAKAKLIADTALHVMLVPQGSAVTDDYRTDRIRIFYDPLSFLVTSPMPQVG